MPKGYVAKEIYQRLATKYNDLHKLYRDLQNRQTAWEARVKKADEKYAAAKESALLWQAWIDKHVTSAKEKRVEKDGETLDEVADASVDEGQHAPVTMKADPAEHVSSSQATEDNPQSSPPNNRERGSDNVPQVVSTRSLKRRRSGSTNKTASSRIKQEYTSQSNPIELASDQFSSPVQQRQKPIRAETSDLDALVQHLDTPRKAKRSRAISEETTRPVTMLRTTSCLSEGDKPKIVEHRVQIKLERSAGTGHLDPATAARDLVAPSASGENEGGALRQISVNSLSGMGRQRKRRYGKTSAKYALLSEDGDDGTNRANASKLEHTLETLVSHRLENLLNEPSPDRQPLPRRRTPEVSSTRHNLHRQAPRLLNNVSNTKALPQKKPQPPSSPIFQRPRGLERSLPPLDPNDEPIRLRPLATLHLDDFKINSKYLGAEFAFADTFRGRDQRRHLHGYTKPEYSGDTFRKAVEVGGAQSTKSDGQVLQDYFGPNWNMLIGAYGPDKRNEIVTQARAYAFANQHGKHRQAFERRSTPPGFWRTDMPTTQEEQEDRAKAHEIERQKVKERWREAFRDDGRWMFRDE